MVEPIDKIKLMLINSKGIKLWKNHIQFRDLK